MAQGAFDPVAEPGRERERFLCQRCPPFWRTTGTRELVERHLRQVHYDSPQVLDLIWVVRCQGCGGLHESFEDLLMHWSTAETSVPCAVASELTMRVMMVLALGGRDGASYNSLEQNVLDVRAARAASQRAIPSAVRLTGWGGMDTMDQNTWRPQVVVVGAGPSGVACVNTLMGAGGRYGPSTNAFGGGY
jgi:hypothetical protein